MLQISRDLGVQLAADGIRCNAVCPGFIKTGPSSPRLGLSLHSNDSQTTVVETRELSWAPKPVLFLVARTLTTKGQSRATLSLR